MEVFDLKEIYPTLEDTSGIRIEHTADNSDKPLCFFGVLCNDKGLSVEKEMMTWLSDEYNVYTIYQDFPGKYYEYPALRFMQYHMMKYNIPYALYLHTKGAYNNHTGQGCVRNMWKGEFTGNNKKKYIDAVKFNKTSVITPLSGVRRETWYNAFFATKEAMELAPLEEPNKDRYFYERLFEHVDEVNIIGILRNLVYAGEAIMASSTYRK